MEHLLAMILTAFDPRKNPVAGLLLCHASQAYDFVVQLHRTADALEATAEDYTTKPYGMDRGSDVKNETVAVTASGRLVSVHAVISL